MARTNRKAEPVKAETAEGGWAWPHLTFEQALERSVLANLLWEDAFYEEGKTNADRIKSLAKKADPEFVSDLAVRARSDYHLRHVPLYLAAALDMREDVKGTGLIRRTVFNVIQRPDEMAELLSMSLIYKGLANDRVKSALSYGARRGMADAFDKFDSYQLTKRLGREDAIKLKDVIALVHPKPADEARSKLYKAIRDGSATPPETWEKSMSSGAGVKQSFEDIIKTGKLGYMALLRNLRKMSDAGIDKTLIKDAILARKGARRVLPFRFLTAARHAPMFENELDRAMVANLQQAPKLPGKSLIVVDVSGSMDGGRLSTHSELSALDGACALGAIARELCEDARIYATAGSDIRQKHATTLVPSRHGMALMDAIVATRREIGGGGIFTRQALAYIAKEEDAKADRIFIITDEQDTDQSRSPLDNVPFGRFNYLLNVSKHQNGIGYGKGWTAHLTGFSERVFDYILAIEQQAG